jgi:hypothetical protein
MLLVLGNHLPATYIEIISPYDFLMLTLFGGAKEPLSNRSI